MEHRLHNVVMARLDAIANAEKVTRHELGHLSRELLTYVMDTQDVEIVNRLMGVLTPMNRATCILYFSHFLPWEHENDKDGKFQRFGKKMLGEKKLAKRVTAIADWLAVEENNVWTWAADNVNVEKKAIDVLGNFNTALINAIKGVEEKNGRPASDPVDPIILIKAMFANGVSLEAMLQACEERSAQEAEALALMGEAKPEVEAEPQGIAA